MKYTEDQIDAYLRGAMTSSEKAAFDADMEQDPALAREVNFMRLIVHGLKDRQEKLEAMEQWQQEAAPRRGTSRPWIPWATAFSAAAALLLGVFLFHPAPSPTLPPDITRPSRVMRGGDFDEIDSLIDQGKYIEAASAIEDEIAEADSLLQESIRIREEADYEIQKYEYILRLLHQKQDEVQAKQGSE